MTLVWGPWFYLSKEAIRVLSLRNYSHPPLLRAMWLLSAGKIWFYLKCNYFLKTLAPLAPNILARVSVVVVLHWPLGEYRLASCHVVMSHLLYTAHATPFCSFICLFVGDRVSLWSWRQAVTLLYSLRLALNAEQPSRLTSAGIRGTSHHTLTAYFITIFSLPPSFFSPSSPPYFYPFPNGKTLFLSVTHFV